MKTLLNGLAWCIALLAAPTPQAATEIRVWHALSAHNQAVFEILIAQFNQSQNQIKVVPSGHASLQAIEAALDRTAPRQAPHLVQLEEPRTRNGMPKRADIQPLYRLLDRTPIQDTRWFVSRQHSYARDAQGRLLAFPYMMEIPVMFYNLDAFQRAGLAPRPERAWDRLQGQLVALANNGSRHCPLTTDKLVSMHLENLAAVNNQLYTSGENGIAQPNGQHPAFLFDTAYVRHLSLMISWVRNELLVHPEFSPQAVTRFAQGECAVLITQSSHLGALLQQPSLRFAVSGLPYYPQLTQHPGNPFVSGSALWSVRGHPASQNKAAATFLGWLAQTDQAAHWYQNTGFLPLTHAAFKHTSADDYAPRAQWRSLIQAYADKPSRLHRGFRVNNYAQIRHMFQDTLDRALRGEQAAVTALRTASVQAGKIMRQR